MSSNEGTPYTSSSPKPRQLVFQAAAAAAAAISDEPRTAALRSRVYSAATAAAAISDQPRAAALRSRVYSAAAAKSDQPSAAALRSRVYSAAAAAAAKFYIHTFLHLHSQSPYILQKNVLPVSIAIKGQRQDTTHAAAYYMDLQGMATAVRRHSDIGRSEGRVCERRPYPETKLSLYGTF